VSGGNNLARWLEEQQENGSGVWTQVGPKGRITRGSRRCVLARELMGVDLIDVKLGGMKVKLAMSRDEFELVLNRGEIGSGLVNFAQC
jgi:hypothetical protein